MLARLLRATDLLIDLAAVAGAVALVVALGVTAVDVIGRNFSAPLYGARDIVSMAGVFVVFGGLAYAHRAGQHIVVDLLKTTFPPAMNRALTVIGHLLGAVVLSLIAWQLWTSIAMARMLSSSTNLLYIPRAPVLIAMTAMAAICAVSMLLRGVQSATEEPARGA